VQKALKTNLFPDFEYISPFITIGAIKLFQGKKKQEYFNKPISADLMLKRPFAAGTQWHRGFTFNNCNWFEMNFFMLKPPIDKPCSICCFEIAR
jgi:hypothetical protein